MHFALFIFELIMVKRLFVVLLVCLTMQGFAQKLTVSGKIVDAEDNEPLIFATIGIKGKPIGTISNNQGEFDFYLPSEFRNEIIVISYLGYENFETPVWSVTDNHSQVFRLKRSSLVLEEIKITDSLSGGEVMEVALARIEKNYPMQPFILDGFYRDLKKVGGTYFALLEAAVKIYDEDYRTPRNKFKLRENVALVEVRKSIGYTNRFTAFFDQHNLLEDLLLHNSVRYRQFEEVSSFFTSLKRMPNTIYNDREVFVVEQTMQYFLRVYIDKKDFSIIRLEFDIDYPDEVLSRRKNLYSKFIGVRKIIDFKEYDNKMYLNYIEVTSRINWYDFRTNELKFETELYQQLLINEVDTAPDYRISSTEKMKRYGLQYQDRAYNKNFWENYNVIKDSPLDKKIIEDIEKQVLFEQ